jgi:hypothetical protein
LQLLYESTQGQVFPLRQLGSASDWQLPGAATRPRRLILSLEDEKPRGHEALYPLLAFGHLGYAGEPHAPDPAPSNDGEEAELQIERYLQLEHVAEPTLSIERYAQISAELAHGYPRPETLARHGLSEFRFTAEETAWLRSIASHAQRGDGRLAYELGRHTEAAHLALAARRPPMTLEAYTSLRELMRSAPDPMRTLQSKGVSLATFLAAERHWQTMRARRDHLPDA